MSSTPLIQIKRKRSLVVMHVDLLWDEHEREERDEVREMKGREGGRGVRE